MTWREKKVRGEQVAPNAAEFIDGNIPYTLLYKYYTFYTPVDES